MIQAPIIIHIQTDQTRNMRVFKVACRRKKDMFTYIFTECLTVTPYLATGLDKQTFSA